MSPLDSIDLNYIKYSQHNPSLLFLLSFIGFGLRQIADWFFMQANVGPFRLGSWWDNNVKREGLALVNWIRTMPTEFWQFCWFSKTYAKLGWNTFHTSKIWGQFVSASMFRLVGTSDSEFLFKCQVWPLFSFIQFNLTLKNLLKKTFARLLHTKIPKNISFNIKIIFEQKEENSKVRKKTVLKASS